MGACSPPATAQPAQPEQAERRGEASRCGLPTPLRVRLTSLVVVAAALSHGPGVVLLAEGVVDADEDTAKHVAGLPLDRNAARALFFELVGKCDRG